MNQETNIHAAFIFGPNTDGVAAVSRPTGGIGLPGGKLEDGETARAAAIRESKEEGWNPCFVSEEPIHVAEVEGKTIAWFSALYMEKLHRFKEVGRISPIVAAPEAVIESGNGNDFILGLESPFLTGKEGISSESAFFSLTAVG